MPDTPQDLTAEQIAKVCHEANRAYCMLIGDHVQPVWEEADDEMRRSAVAGVKMVLRFPAVSSEEAHEHWRKFKELNGWTYGPVRDDARKVHPCMVPYWDLPALQRYKDHLFKNVVKAFMAEK